MDVPAPHAAVEVLYRAFAHRRRPSCLYASPVKDPAAVAKLLAVPLRDVDARAILHYSVSAMTTIGTAEDFAYFLPRILEVATDGPAAGLADPFIIAGKLELADWRDWSEAEQTAVEDALRSVFVRMRRIDPNEGQAFPWLEAMMRAGVDLRPALGGWLADRGSAPLLQLADCLSMLANRVARNDLAHDRPEILRDLIAWCIAEATVTAIVERADEVPLDRTHLLDEAVDAIGALADSSVAHTLPRS